MTGNPNTRTARTILLYLLLIVVGLIIVFPILYALSVSFMTADEAAKYPPRFLPGALRLVNYRTVLERLPIPRYLLNSFIVSLSVMIAQLVTASLAAYAFAVRQFRGRQALFMLFLSTLMIPWEVTIIPNYQTIIRWDWKDSYQALIAPFIATAFGTFLLRQFFLTISYEVDDAARIDGAGFLDLFWRIALPLAKPAIGVVAMMAIVTRWNEFTEPLIYLSTKDQFTISVGLRAFQTEQNFLHVPVLMASSTVAVLPLIVLFFAGQRFFVQGISLSGMR